MSVCTNQRLDRPQHVAPSRLAHGGRTRRHRCSRCQWATSQEVIVNGRREGMVLRRGLDSNFAAHGPVSHRIQEAYLIETRTHKMPYKHIAAHLKKTELACRLHYHQLSYGNKRPRHHAPSSSVGSIEHRSGSPSGRAHDDLQQRPLPAFHPPSSPDRFGQPSDPLSASSPNHVPILPKPIPSAQRASHHTKSLRLITEDMGSPEKRQVIDMQRLNRIYNAHRIHFWSMVAQSYGSNVSPSALEDAWRREQVTTCRADFPPTPCGSPESAKPASSILSGPFGSAADHGKGFTPINTPQSTISTPSTIERGTFAISSLLTEDKEVRSPPHEKRM